MRAIVIVITAAFFGAALAQKPANSAMSTEARAVLAYIQSLEGTGWISGQREQSFSAFGEAEAYIYNTTGKRPAIHGEDMNGLIEYGETRVADKINRRRYFNQLITIDWHMGAPPLADTYANSKQQVSIDDVLTPGTTEYESFVHKLDSAAGFLALMQDADVPVLWRPWHEMTGAWFWWGKDGADQFKRLWIFMYDYFTHSKQLNNLIWVWSAAHTTNDVASYYPGDAYVDILGVDIYNGSYTASFHRIDSISEKPVALTENNSDLPTPEFVQQRGVDYVWFFPWHTQWIEGIPQDTLRHIYTHNYTITLDELPEFGRTPVRQLLLNPSFELGVTFWTGLGDAHVSQENQTVSSNAGSLACKVSGRTQNWHGPSQTIRAGLTYYGPGRYIVAAAIRTASGSDECKLTINLKDSGEERWLGNVHAVSASAWTQIVDTITIGWQGDLSQARLFVETSNSLADFYVDAARVEKADPSHSAPIAQQLVPGTIAASSIKSKRYFMLNGKAVWNANHFERAPGWYVIDNRKSLSIRRQLAKQELIGLIY
ncbi:MAG: hypothetical protein GF398_16525 [Chitinivibrionales bacterium]|nr:hypothetical protein [Chitinivibrionales bacterium]